MNMLMKMALIPPRFDGFYCSFQIIGRLRAKEIGGRIVRQHRPSTLSRSSVSAEEMAGSVIAETPVRRHWIGNHEVDCL